MEFRVCDRENLFSTWETRVPGAGDGQVYLRDNWVSCFRVRCWHGLRVSGFRVFRAVGVHKT